MVGDFYRVFQWWGTLFLLGAAAFPLTKALFTSMYKGSTFGKVDPSQIWWDGGYLFSKAVGMAVVAWLVYALGTLKILPFTVPTVIFALILLFTGGILLRARSEKREARSKTNKNKFFNVSRITYHVSPFILEEFFFFAALLFWSWIKAHEPSIRGLEKFMDYGFMKSIVNSTYFPPADMWYAGLPINYYYFGHLVTAVLTKLSGLDLSYTFNLMLATLFALTLTMSFSIGYQLISEKREARSEKREKQLGILNFLLLISYRLLPLFGGLLTAFLVTFAGNLQTIYAFTKGYTGDNVRPFWELLWPLAEFWQKLPEGLNRYWYANATRFIPLTIHEFPSYSFVVSDVHGHVLSIPFALLVIALLIQMAISEKREAIRNTSFFFSLISYRFLLIFFGFLVGVLFMTNVLDGPIYLSLFVVLLLITQYQKSNIKNLGTPIALVTVVAVLTTLPFLTHFQSFVSGLAINCPPAFLANSKIGPFLFEGVEKCQRSPLWMLYLLWGFFWFCGIALIVSRRWKMEDGRWKKMRLLGFIGEIWNTRFTQIEKVLVVFFFFSLALIIFPEFFYFKDIYPAYFRSNTMFKLGYQAFILFSIVSGYTIVRMLTNRLADRGENIKYQISNIKYTYIKSKITKSIFLVLLLPQLFLVSIYPIFSVRSYFGGLRQYEGLYGLNWLKNQYLTDYSAITWLNNQIPNSKFPWPGRQGRQIPNSAPLALVEADGDSYTDYGRFSAFTGIPTIVGWPVHEWLWRGSYDVVAPRREEVRRIYESDDVAYTKKVLSAYHVRYVVVGSLERQKFNNLKEEKFRQLGELVFQRGETALYLIR